MSMPEDKDYRENLHSGAGKNIFQNARDLRRVETPAEKLLWQCLRNRQLKGRKFRRQHPFDKYVLDFYCHECRLAVELDGSTHDEIMNKQYDETRTAELKRSGIIVLRFRNEEVIKDIDEVLRKIEAYLN